MIRDLKILLDLYSCLWKELATFTQLFKVRGGNLVLTLCWWEVWTFFFVYVHLSSQWLFLKKTIPKKLIYLISKPQTETYQWTTKSGSPAIYYNYWKCLDQNLLTGCNFLFSLKITFLWISKRIILWNQLSWSYANRVWS